MESIEQLKQSVDLILSKLDENTNLLTDIASIKVLVQSIVDYNEKYFDESDFINHRLFIILRNCYLNLLQQWRQGFPLDDTCCYIFDKIPRLFSKMSHHINDRNILVVKELLFHEALLNELNKCLEDIASNEKYLVDAQLKSLDNIFRAIQHLEKTCSDNKNYILLTKLFENAVKCICSSSFIKMFILGTKQENDNTAQTFFLHTCTEYIYFHSINQEHRKSFEYYMKLNFSKLYRATIF